MDLIAEDLLLLLIDEESGRPLVDSTKLTSSLAGALVIELALDGVIVPEDPDASGAKSPSSSRSAPRQPTRCCS